jgi:hypothetical protein
MDVAAVRSGTLATVRSAQSSIREADKRSAEAAPTIGRVRTAPHRRNRGLWLALVANHVPVGDGDSQMNREGVG